MDYSSILSVLIVKPRLIGNYPSNLQSVAESKLLKYSDGRDAMRSAAVASYIGPGIPFLLQSNASNSTEIQDLKKIVPEIKDVFPSFYENIFQKTSYIFIKHNRDLAFNFFVKLVESLSTKVIAVNKPLSNLFFEYYGYFVDTSYLKSRIDHLFSILSVSGIYSGMEDMKNSVFYCEGDFLVRS